jgi:hypothetical protein
LGTVDPYTQWGLYATIKLNNSWTVQLGMCAGNDVTPWEVQDPGCQPTGIAMIQYISPNNKFSFYGGGNTINNAAWGYNNLQQYVGTFQLNISDKWKTQQESWYMFQMHCPGQTGGPGSTAADPVPVGAADEPYGQGREANLNGHIAFQGYANGQIPVLPGYAPAWATVNYTYYRLGPNTFFTIRNEFFDDIDGERTGYATLYSEHSIGITWWPCKLMTVRPEFRFDHSYGTHGNSLDPVDEAKPFDNGTRRNQCTAEFDVIYHF